ncbi:hypothetical protein AVEN_188667-1 [Araneus ventricosus]|uniref:Integrase catalytic domain-containing protein n=1 Tax=Araneus ventricosus TaxID=182803 RepID=A0A4Y2KQA4_ARAVE|nr:hypothetical protein AVEN_188667-1 [Araneus ventricosus]
MGQHSRWPEAVPLRCLIAKSTYDALLETFMRTGIPNVIASNQGNNFISKLTQEFHKRLGSSLNFSCPGYSVSNGLVEICHKVLKQMLHHVIRTAPSNSDKHIPYLLFVYREVPNCPTAVSPFQLMHGRQARVPLVVLKSSWSGEVPSPTNISQSAVDYLQELKLKMEQDAEQVKIFAERKQQSYADYFNKNTTSKSFRPGDQIYLLIPDSSIKLYARWKGPGEIIKHIPPHSYLVKLSDGKKQIHGNKIRKFQMRVNTIGVIFENEEEFGEITVPEKYYLLPSQKL